MARSNKIRIKKKYGQHFLRDRKITQKMLASVSLDTSSSIFEIGCGDGFLTQAILQHKFARLWVFEIDKEWVEHLKKTTDDARLSIFHENILDTDFSHFKKYAPWTLLANLPYQVTFPILYKLFEHRGLLKEGVIMVQEEVAQKILKTSGRGYGQKSLFFQYYFEWKKLDKIPPTAFYPPPKVYSRLLYFKPKKSVPKISDEEQFWKFVKMCFAQPRRTLRNNLAQTHFAMEDVAEHYLDLRAQQMSMDDFLTVWKQLKRE